MFPNLFQRTFLFVDIIIVLLVLIPFCIYLRSLQKTLEFISPENRKMPPARVWITAIPIYGAIWHFFVVNAMADSLRLEFLKNNIRLKTPRPTYQMGLTTSLCAASSVIPQMGMVFLFAALVCWIIYWVQVGECRNKIEHARMREKLTAV